MPTPETEISYKYSLLLEKNGVDQAQFNLSLAISVSWFQISLNITVT